MSLFLHPIQMEVSLLVDSGNEIEQKVWLFGGSWPQMLEKQQTSQWHPSQLQHPLGVFLGHPQWQSKATTYKFIVGCSLLCYRLVEIQVMTIGSFWGYYAHIWTLTTFPLVNLYKWPMTQLHKVCLSTWKPLRWSQHGSLLSEADWVDSQVSANYLTFSIEAAKKLLSFMGTCILSCIPEFPWSIGLFFWVKSLAFTEAFTEIVIISW